MNVWLVIALDETFQSMEETPVAETANIGDVVLVLSSFIRTEPVFCMKHLFSINLLHFMTKYINSDYIRDFFIALFDPNDFSLNITKQIKENLYKYAYQTGFIMNMTAFMLHPKIGINNKKYTRDYKYDCKNSIAKIKTPFFYQKDFSKIDLRPDYYSNKKYNEYVGATDIDRIKPYLMVAKE